MKTTTILVLVLYSFSLLGQNYIPMLQEGKTWDIYFWQNGNITPYIGGQYCYIAGDTIINTITYQKIDCKEIIPIDQPVFAGPFELSDASFRYALMREDTIAKKVYSLIYSQNTEETNEYLVYDFSLEIGDTLIVPEIPDIDENDCCFFEARLDTIYELSLLNGSVSRAFEFSLVNYEDGVKRIYIEGLGSTSLFLPFDYAFEFGAHLLCAQIEGMPFWAENLNSGYSCTSIVPTNEVEVKNRVNIYPNPTDGWLNVESTVPIMQIRIYSMNGNLIDVVQNIDPKINLGRNKRLSPGIYLVQMIWEDGIHYSKILIN